jgi:Fur family iron response transcriptional regulator
MSAVASAIDAAPVLSREDVTRLLGERGLKPTRQRVVVAEVLLAQPTHLSAEQILASLRAAGESISKATVYNTLNALVESGLVRQIHLDPNRSVYDSTRANHHHFHDVDSGTLLDIKPDDIVFARLPPLPEGMETASVEVVIRVRRRTTS